MTQPNAYDQENEPTMRIHTHPVNDGVVRLAVTGEIDLASANDLYEAITTAAASAVEVVVDLADVVFCDSTGIGALIRARTTAAAEGVGVTVINPRGIVHRALDVTGVLHTLTNPAGP